MAARRSGGRGLPLGAGKLHFTPPHPLHSIREEPAPRRSRQGPTHASFPLAAGRSPSRVARGPRGRCPAPLRRRTAPGPDQRDDQRHRDEHAGQGLAGVLVTVVATGDKGVTNTRGTYTIERVPAGQQTLTFRWLGYAPLTVTANVTAGGVTTVDAKLEQSPIQLSELTVTGASKV